MRPKKRDKTYFAYIPIYKIKPSKLNPRKIFDELSIKELADSFVDYGMIQPLLVYPNNSHFVILCGERRWRAAKIANLAKVPAIIYPSPPRDEVAISMALVENMHRKDVDIVSEATAIRTLIDNFGWSKKRLSQKLGVSIGYIHNRMLLSRYKEILEILDKGKISVTEAIELASIPNKSFRILFYQRLVNGEFVNCNDFSKAIARHKHLQRIVKKGWFNSRVLDRSLVQFELSDLPCCGQGCKFYFRLTWEEREQLGLPTEKPFLTRI